MVATIYETFDIFETVLEFSEVLFVRVRMKGNMRAGQALLM